MNDGNKRIAILIGTRDRPTELFGLLQSLRTQTYQTFDILVVDDCSGTPMQDYQFINSIVGRLLIEGHNVKMVRNGISNGVSRMRQQCVDFALQHFSNCDLFLRIDDDTLAEPDFIQKLVDTINNGYDLASGLTPPLAGPDWKREVSYIEPVVNRVVLDETGGFLINGDDCGYSYIESKILPTHHFRSTALYKKEVHTVYGINYEENLSKSGMREEEFFSFRCILAGLKLGVHTGAIHYHLMTKSGGQRTATPEMHIQNQRILNRFVKKKVKEKGDFIKAYNERLGVSEDNNLVGINKNTNFIMTKDE